MHLKYRLVFSLDLTPSMASLDPITGTCLLDNLFPALQRAFLDLVKPINLPSIGLQVSSALPEIPRVCRALGWRLI